jgi:hypothetical protein
MVTQREWVPERERPDRFRVADDRTDPQAD